LFWIAGSGSPVLDRRFWIAGSGSPARMLPLNVWSRVLSSLDAIALNHRTRDRVLVLQSVTPVRSTHVALLFAASCAGCMVGDSGTDTQLDATTLDVTGNYHALTRINNKPYGSSLGDFEINSYVWGDLADYRRIHPEENGSHVMVAVGTVIVREVLDASGGAAKLTVMAKGPPGYDPSLGDWWFGVTDPAGKPIIEDGVPKLGRLTECHECHLERAADDFLFGVPEASD
jgi:hypothetical protein